MQEEAHDRAEVESCAYAEQEQQRQMQKQAYAFT